MDTVNTGDLTIKAVIKAEAIAEVIAVITAPGHSGGGYVARIRPSRIWLWPTRLWIWTNGYRRGNRHRHAGSSNYCSINHSYSSGYGSYGYNNGYNSGYGNNGYRDRNSGYGRGYSSGSGYGYNNGRGHRQSRYQVGGRYGYGSHSVILGDYNAYGLYSPPHGYHWVRDRDRRDAILCSVATGAIIGLAVGVLNEY